MAIESHKDPKTRKEYLLAVGKVDGVYINALKEVKTYSGPNGPWTPTHSINMIVDGDRISLGLTDKESVRAKDVNDQYQDVERGAEVSVVVVEDGEYKGAPTYRSRASQITVLETAPKQEKAAPAQGGKQTFKPRDNSGVETGHALNGGLNLVRSGVFEGVVESSKIVHTLTTSLKKEYAEKNPQMSEYDVGAMVGHAVLNGTRDANSLEEVETLARDLLDNVVPEVSAYVKGYTAITNKKAVGEKPVTKAKPGCKPKAEPVVEEPQESENPAPDFDDDDGDIPF